MTEPGPNITGFWGAVVYFASIIGSGAAAWAYGRRRRPAAEAAEVAGYEADESRSKAESGLYQRLLERVVQLEDGYRRLEQELDAERRLRRHMEDHVGLLERLMRAASLDPPAFEPFARGEGSSNG